MYKPYIDENNRLHIFCLCDGTYIFLLQLVKVLAEMGCSDIHTNGDIVTEGYRKINHGATIYLRQAGFYRRRC